MINLLSAKGSLYWITRADVLWTVFFFFCFIWLFASIYAIYNAKDTLDWSRTERTMWDHSKEELAAEVRKTKRLAIFSVIAFFSNVILVVLTPTTNDLLLIYGGGEVLEYLQGNDKVKELPDKTVEMLDQWLDKQLEKEKK